MEPNTDVMAQAMALKELIQNFLQERLQVKLDKLKDDDDEKRQTIIERYQLATWIDSAAKRVQKISMVTHAIKYQNPYATGSSLYTVTTKKQNYDLKWVTTESVKNPMNDAVCDTAADWPVYTFLHLHLSYDTETLLSRMLRNDAALRAALPLSEEKKDSWFKSFCSIKELKGKPSTSSLAKQFYFPLSDGQYHLLAPLYPTSLVHKGCT